MRVALYIKMPTEKQAAEDKVALDQQRQACHIYCKEQGIEVVAVYEDRASSQDSHCSGFEQMLADGLEGKFNVIVAYQWYGLTRTPFAAARIGELVRHHGIRLESVTEPSDSGLMAIMCAVASMESERLKELTSRGRSRAALQGRVPCGGPPYGYRTGEDGRPEPDPKTCSVVKRIVREYGEGRTAAEIARELNEEGVPPPGRGGEWRASQIHRILLTLPGSGTTARPGGSWTGGGRVR